MIKEFENSLTRQPKSMAIILLVLLMVWKVPVILMLSLVFLPFMLLGKRLKLGMVGLAIALSVAMWLLDEISIVRVIDQNNLFYQALFYAHWVQLKMPFMWLSSMPAAILLSAIFSLLLSMKKGHRDEIKRIAKGELSEDDKLSEKQISKALTRIKTAYLKSGSTLGINTWTGSPILLSDQDANLHTLAIGTTGSGKTTTVCNIVESAIDRQIPVFYVDGKGDGNLANKLKEYAGYQQRPFYLFSMCGESVRYNPLAVGGSTSKKDRIVELREWSEDHYRKIAEGYLQTVFYILAQCGQSIDLITLAKYLSPDALYHLARQSNNQAVLAQIEKLEDKEKQISSLIAEIENMANSEIGHLFDCQGDDQNDVLTLSKALEENAVVYFCLKPLAFPAYASSLGKLIINDLKALASLQLEKPEKKIIYTIFDEFSVFAGDQIINLINQGRSAGIHAILSTQSLADISRCGGEALLGQTLSNCNNYLIQRQNYPQDAEQLAHIIGTSDNFQITSQVDMRAGTTGVGSVRATKEFMVHPDKIKRLKQGEGIVVNKQKFNVQYAQFRQSSITS